MIDERQITQRYRLLAPHLSDREMRLWAAAEATAHGPGAIAAIARVTGLSPSMIKRAQQELRDQPSEPDTPNSSD
jgi:hypothetical protein